MSETIETSTPTTPSIQGKDKRFEFEARLALGSPVIQTLLGVTFSPELANAVVNRNVAKNRIHPHLNTIFLNRHLALVGGSG